MNATNIATAILLFAHGSRVEEANRGVRELAREVERNGDRERAWPPRM